MEPSEIKRKKVKYAIGETLKVHFDCMAFGGKAKGTVQSDTPSYVSVFSEGAAPGDLAEVSVIKQKKNYVEGKLERILTRGPSRSMPVCEHFGECGGCNWQHIDYKTQKTEKLSIFEYVLKRNGMLPKSPIDFVEAVQGYGYRRRADIVLMKMGNQLFGGFRQAQSHRLVDIERCPLLVEPLEDAIDLAKKMLVREELGDIRENEPFKVRILYDEGQQRCILQSFRNSPIFSGEAKTFLIKDSELKELETNVMSYQIDGMNLKYHPLCFTQVNAQMNQELVKIVIDGLAPEADDTILELYGGIGNFALPISKKVKDVTMVEASMLSTRFAQRNCDANSVDNVSVFDGNVLPACKRLLRQKRKFTKVLFDPPRAGMGNDTARMICKFAPKKLVSVSCHPNTLTNDLKVFLKNGYKIQTVKTIDMFPQTYHLESVVTLTRS